MSRRAFENFGIAAERTDDYTVTVSRYLHQSTEEKYIVMDIIEKLNITPYDTCLDIGCGVGNILIPLSFFSKSITGMDHSKCLKKLKKRVLGINNAYLIPGNFLDITIKGRFDKIIAYSVLQYLENTKEVIKFIDKAISLLKPNGRLLLGDLPNVSKEKRFFNSKEGKRYQLEWDRKRAKSRKKTKVECISDLLQDVEKDTKLVMLDDDVLLSIVAKARRKGLNAYFLPQPARLPFGRSREDILIERYDD